MRAADYSVNPGNANKVTACKRHTEILLHNMSITVLYLACYVELDFEH